MKHLLALLLLCTACASGGAVLSMGSFDNVSIGATESQVIEALGPPARIQKRDQGLVDYEYVERFKAGGRDLEERRYILTFKDGRVASKQIKQSSPPPYLLDSYDMQTTQRDAAAE